MTSTQDEREGLRERVAKAIHECNRLVPWDQTSQQDVAYERADAAIAAMASLPAPDTALPDIGPDPFKGSREDYTLANAEKRLRDALTVQQKGVPDQTALVWRCDLLKLFHELPRLRSIEEDWREKRAAPQAPATGGDAVRDMIAERTRQVQAEGWTTAHDDHHVSGELGLAAALYALPYESGVLEQDDFIRLDMLLELSFGWNLKPEPDRRRRLVKAGALILAEIERMDRAALNPTAAEGGES